MSHSGAIHAGFYSQLLQGLLFPALVPWAGGVVVELRPCVLLWGTSGTNIHLLIFNRHTMGLEPTHSAPSTSLFVASSLCLSL